MDFTIFMINASVNSNCAQAPPGLLQGICQSQGWGICKFCAAWGPGICQPRGYSQAFDTYVVSYPNITTQKILLEKQAYWLICQWQEKIEEGCKRCVLSYPGGFDSSRDPTPGNLPSKPKKMLTPGGRPGGWGVGAAGIDWCITLVSLPCFQKQLWMTSPGYNTSEQGPQ